MLGHQTVDAAPQVGQGWPLGQCDSCSQAVPAVRYECAEPGCMTTLCLGCGHGDAAHPQHVLRKLQQPHHIGQPAPAVDHIGPPTPAPAVDPALALEEARRKKERLILQQLRSSAAATLTPAAPAPDVLLAAEKPPVGAGSPVVTSSSASAPQQSVGVPRVWAAPPPPYHMLCQYIAANAAPPPPPPPPPGSRVRLTSPVHFGSPAPPPPPPPPPPPSGWKVARHQRLRDARVARMAEPMSQLVEMGYTDLNVNMAVLEACHGSVATAVTELRWADALAQLLRLDLKVPVTALNNALDQEAGNAETVANSLLDKKKKK